MVEPSPLSNLGSLGLAMTVILTKKLSARLKKVQAFPCSIGIVHLIHVCEEPIVLIIGYKAIKVFYKPLIDGNSKVSLEQFHRSQRICIKHAWCKLYSGDSLVIF